MNRFSDKFVDFVQRAFAHLTEDGTLSVGNRSWIDRGVGNSVSRLGITTADDEGVQLAAVWSIAFEAGALEALRFASIILSDPKVRGRETEALQLIRDGHGHAAILASLRESKPVSQPNDSKVIALRPREDRS